ncbi:MAG: ABC transporter permease, partial [Oscillospiraceae bacterium]
MIKKSYYKDVFKSITHTLSRFISIFLMVALGAGFYAGLNATAPDMRFTINDYYKTNNMMDINLVSTMGFTESDINEIKQYSDIKSIMPSYSADIIGKTNETERIIKIHTIPQNDEENYINRAILKNGRLPQKAGECVINVSDVEEYDLKIGSKIAVSLVSDNAKDNLKTREFEIVGLVDSPCYITFNLGSSTIGNGKLNNYIYITEDNFEGDYYTEVFLTFKSTEKLQVFSQEYNKKINSIKEDLEIISKQSGALRKDEIFQQANEKINIAKAELEN